MGDFYTVCLNLKGCKCLVVGGGKVAERKVQTLIDCGGNVTVVSPVITSKLDRLNNDGIISCILREYNSADLDDVFLVISATDNEALNGMIADECFRRKILVNVVDDPPKCNFIIPSTLNRGALSVSVSTGGKSPLLARKLREQLEETIGPEYEAYVELLGQVRRKVLQEVPDQIKRQKIFQNLIESDLLELIRTGQDSKVKERISSVFGDSGLKP